MKLDIVIVAYRSEAWLPRLLEDLQAMTRLPYRLHFFDNTGNPMTLSRAWNSLASSGDAPFIAILNPDIALSPGWDERLIRVLEDDPSIGICVPNPFGSSPTAGPQPSREAMKEIAASLGMSRELVPFDEALYAFCIRRSTWETLHGVDERLRFLVQDTDLIHRAKDLGLRTVKAISCPVWHRGSDSIREAQSKGEIDLYLESVRSLDVFKRIRAGEMKFWQELTDAEREQIRFHPVYGIMGQ